MIDFDSLGHMADRNMVLDHILVHQAGHDTCCSVEELRGNRTAAVEATLAVVAAAVVVVVTAWAMAASVAEQGPGSLAAAELDH